MELLGGDAHLGCLFLGRINAHDLGKPYWCDLGSNMHFKGRTRDAERILRDIAGALCYLHHQKVVHNDVKPANILYRRGNGAVLIDFGHATSTDYSPPSGGTPWYPPPEFLSRKKRGPPSDVFALGVVMIFLLGHIAIPESGQQSKSWRIAQVNSESASSATIAMATWLGVIQDARQSLEVATDRTTQLVVRMLKPRPRERITARELDTILQTDLRRSPRLADYGKRT